MPNVQRKRWRISAIDGFGNFGAADGVFVVENFPAVAADGESQVGIFRNRVAGKSAVRAQQIGAPRAHGAGHHRNAIQQIEGALFQVLAGDVFERLPAREPAIAVHHFHVAGDGADLGIGEMADEPRNRFGINDGICVDRNDDFAGGFGKTMIQRRGLAAIGLADQAHAGFAAEICAHQFGGAIRRAIVDHENFELGIIASERRVHGFDDGGFLVVRRDQHGDTGLVLRMIGGRGRSFSISASKPIISARPLTSRIPAIKMNAIPARNQRNTSKMKASARTISHSWCESGGITCARDCPSRSETETNS